MPDSGKLFCLEGDARVHAPSQSVCGEATHQVTHALPHSLARLEPTDNLVSCVPKRVEVATWLCFTQVSEVSASESESQ